MLVGKCTKPAVFKTVLLLLARASRAYVIEEICKERLREVLREVKIANPVTLRGVTETSSKQFLSLTCVLLLREAASYFLEWLLIVTFEKCALLLRRKYCFSL